MSRFRIRCSAVSAVAGRRRRAAAVSVAAYMALALLLAACTPGWDPGGSELVELQVDGQLVADGPDVQSVTLRAGGRPSAGFTFGSLQVYGDESPVEPLAVTESRPGASVREAVVALDVRSLAEAGVRVVRFVLGDAEAVVEIVYPGGGPGGRPGEEPGDDPDPDHGSEPPEPKPDPGQDPDPGPGTDPDPGTDPGPGADPDPGENPGSGEDPGAGEDPNPGTAPDPGTDPDPDPGSDPDPGPDPEPPVTREVRTLRPGTADATDVYIIRSAMPGPTVMIVGGVHG
ncbi:MAG: hypothetical protein FWJ61_07330, partial [Limnochordales bacterium]